jgi:hypothetical protein
MDDQPPRPPDEEPTPGTPMPGGPPPSPGPPPSVSPPPAPSTAPAPIGWASPPYQPPAPPPDDITGYLRAHAGRYTREALTARLVSAGHGRDAIDGAWAAVDAEDAAAGRRDRRGTVSAIVGGAYLLTWLAITVMWLVGAPYQGGSVLLVSGILAFFLFIPGVIGFALARNSRRLRRAGTGTAIAFALVPLLILGALAGTCVAIVPPTGFS